MRLVALVVFAIGCGPHQGFSDPAAKMVLSSKCPITAKDLSRPLPTTKASCVNGAFAADPVMAAKLLGQLEWTDEQKSKLAKLPIDEQNWYRIAKHAGPNRTALSALAFARRTQDATFATDVDLETVRVADALGDAEAANRASERLADQKNLEGGQRAAMLKAFAARKDRARIERVCAGATDVKSAWPCLEAAPDLPAALDAVVRLPTLSFAEIDRFTSNPALSARFPRLACATQKPEGIRWMFEKINNPPTPLPSGGEVILYRRLAKGAKPDASACFLQASAIACLQRVQAGSDCPALSSVADYLLTVKPEDRNEYIQPMIVSKTDTYELLRNDSSSDAKAILFHLHVVLAESLIISTSRPRDRLLWLPQYHVQRAWRFWSTLSTPEVSFEDFFSQPLIDAVCADRNCDATCKNSGWTDCKKSCKLDQPAYQSICAAEG